MLGLETALALALTELDLPDRRRSSRCCRGSRPRIAGVDDAPRRPDRRGPPGQPLRDRPRPPPGPSTRPRWPAAAATRPTPAARSPAGSATRSCAASRSSSTARPSDESNDASSGCDMTSARRCSCWPTARRSRARPIGADRRRRRHRRGRVQHRADRLPGGHHRPVLRRADHHLHLPAHRQLRRQRRRRREPPAVLPGRRRPRAGPPPQQLAQRRRPRRLPAPPRRARHRRHRHPPAHPPHPRRRRDARRVRHGRRGRRCRRRPPAEPGTDGVDLVATVTTRRAVHASATGPRRVVAYDFGIKRTILRHLAALGDRRGRARRRRRPPTCWPASPTACSCRTAPATRPRSPYAVEAIRGLLGEVPVFGICLGHQLLGLALGGDDRTSCRSATTAATTRCATSPPARVEITSQNHNFAVDADALGRRRRGHPREPQRRRRRGHAGARRPGLQRAAPPRGRARARTTPATCSTSSPTLMAERDARQPLMPQRDDLESILLIGSGPIVIGQACEFDYSGTQACRVLRRGGLPGHPRQLEPGDDHDRPRVRRRHLHRAARRRRARRRSSSGSGPTPCCRPSAARPR